MMQVYGGDYRFELDYVRSDGVRVGRLIDTNSNIIKTKHTIFPENWDEFRIANEFMRGGNDIPVPNRANTYDRTLMNGIKVRYFTDGNGGITSLFPLE